MWLDYLNDNTHYLVRMAWWKYASVEEMNTCFNVHNMYTAIYI